MFKLFFQSQTQPWRMLLHVQGSITAAEWAWHTKALESSAQAKNPWPWKIKALGGKVLHKKQLICGAAKSPEGQLKTLHKTGAGLSLLFSDAITVSLMVHYSW